MDATHVNPGASNCNHCATLGRDRQWEPRILRQGLCKVGYSQAKAAGNLPVKRLPKGEKRQCGAVTDDKRCPNDAKAHGLCPTHLARRYRGAEVDAPIRRGAQAPECTFGGCDRPRHSSDGLCAGHTTQRLRGKPLTPLRTYKPRAGQCEAVWEGERCPRDVANDGLCAGHHGRRTRMKGAPGWERPIRRKSKHGEGYLTDDGYRIIYVDGRKYREHVYVMEQEYGGPLPKGATVHHKKGGFKGRSNNDPSNLELWTGNHPKGHRVEDVTDYCLVHEETYVGLMTEAQLVRLEALGQVAAERLAATAAAC